MMPRGGRPAAQSSRFFKPENFIWGTAALGAAGLACLGLSFLLRYTLPALVLQLMALALLVSTFPYTLIGLCLAVARRRQILYAILGGLAVMGCAFLLFLGIIRLYGAEAEVWRTPWNPLELSAAAELVGFGLLVYSVAGFHLGCWIVYRKLHPRDLPDSTEKVLKL
jgi:hypothetical protein